MLWQAIFEEPFAKKFALVIEFFNRLEIWTMQKEAAVQNA